MKMFEKKKKKKKLVVLTYKMQYAKGQNWYVHDIINMSAVLENHSISYWFTLK